MNPTASRAGEQDIPQRSPRRLAAVGAERARVKLHVDVELIVQGKVSHSGACLYAALTWLWYENVSDTSTLARLEQASGRKRLDPVVVTAEMLYPLTGLRKDAISARIRELEEPRACVWHGCLDPHPLITVRRIGQGQGLQVQRYFCGDPEPVPRKRVVFQNPSVPPSEQDAQNPELPDSRIGRSRIDESGNDPTQNAAPPDSLIRNSYNTTTPQHAAAATEESKERAAALERIVPQILALARVVEPDSNLDHAARLSERLLDAALRYHDRASDAAIAVTRAVVDKRVSKASRPLAMLIRGVLGEAKDGRDAFLLARGFPSPDALPSAVTALESMPAGLRETLLERVRNGDLDPRWLSRSDVPRQALKESRELIADEEMPYPLGERLRQADATEYSRRLNNALDRIDIPKRLGIPPSLESIIFAAAAKRRLEIDLADEEAK